MTTLGAAFSVYHYASNHSQVAAASAVTGVLAPIFCAIAGSVPGFEFFERLEGIVSGLSLQLSQISGKGGKEKFRDFNGKEWGGLIFSGVLGLLGGFFSDKILDGLKDRGEWGGVYSGEEGIYKTSYEAYEDRLIENYKIKWGNNPDTFNSANLKSGLLKWAGYNGFSNMIVSSSINIYNKRVSGYNISGKALGVNALENFGFGAIMGGFQTAAAHTMYNFNRRGLSHVGEFWYGANGIFIYGIAFAQGSL